MGKRLFIIPFLFLFFFLLHFSPVFADSTGYKFPTVRADGTEYTNPDNILLRDGNLATCTSCSALITVYGFPDFGIPSGSTVNSISVRANMYATDTTTLSIKSSSTTKCFTTNGSGTAPSFTTPTSSAPPQDKITTINNSTQCSSFWTSSNLGASNLLRISLVRSTGLQTYGYDDVSVSVDYTPPTFSITASNVIASASAGILTMDLSGDFATKSATMKCEVDIYEQCLDWNGNSGYSYTQNSPIVHGLFDAENPRSTTLDQGNGYYLGRGFSATSSAWFIDKVKVPYRAGKSCSYPSQYQCYHQVCSSYTTTDPITGATIPHHTCSDPVIDAQSSGVFTSDTTVSPTEAQNAPGNKMPDCQNDIICSIRDWFQSFITFTFGFDTQFSTRSLSELKNNIQGHAPFAYVYPIFNIDLSAVNTATSAPTLSINTTTPTSIYDTTANPLIPTSVSWSDPSGIVGSFASGFRTTFVILLWLAFVFYIFFLVRRII